MVRWRVAEAAEAMGGRVHGDPSVFFTGAALDNRGLRGGELFFALPGDQTDGHRFVGAAAEAGAAAAVVHHEVEVKAGFPLVVVEDSYRALHDLTRAVRRKVPEHLVAISGSAGKTTTKELLADILSSRFRTGRTPGNLNNLYGFPIALMSIDDDSEWMVAEMGMSTPGELAGVSRLGRPEVAVFTNVLAAHTEFFGGIEGVTEAKAELLAGLDEDGLVVANADDPRVVEIAGRHPGRVLFYGIEEKAEVRALEIGLRGGGKIGSRFTLDLGGERYATELALHGRFNIANYLAAAACAWALGVDPEAIVAAAAEAKPAGLRGEVHHVADRIVIDDSYNSNPSAARLALESAAELPATRHWAVLGDMLELGESAERAHEEIGHCAAELGFELVLGVGELARQIVEAAGRAGARTRWAADAAEAAMMASREIRAGDLVLVKGSRSIGLEAVASALLASPTVEGAP